MFFIIKTQCFGFKMRGTLSDPADNNFAETVHLRIRDVCLIVEYETEESHNRSLVLHPEYGMIRVFIDDERGDIIGEISRC